MYLLWQLKKVSQMKQFKEVFHLVPSITWHDISVDYLMEVYLLSVLRINDAFIGSLKK